MNKLFCLIFLSSTISFISSCSSKKNILYVQNINNSKNYDFTYSDYLIKADDILKIDVFTESKELSVEYNPSAQFAGSMSKEAFLFKGYQVNSDGSIFFPSIGEIKVAGKTLTDLKVFISNYLTDGGFLMNPFIDIKLINLNFTILGEVNSPGRYEFLKNNLNILEAIGMAGDLSINGVREDVLLIRDNNGKKFISSIDLTSTDFLTDPAYQIYSGDIIIVKPNSSRIKNAGIIGNSGTLLSLLSFLLSTIIVATN